MGYTHYWDRPLELPQYAWDAWTKDVTKILANLPATRVDNYAGIETPQPLIVAFEEDEPNRPPQIDGELVRFNGTGRSTGIAPDRYAAYDGYDLGHETFYVRRVIEPESYQQPDERGRYFEFCKTAQKPYDLAVVACLIRMAARMAEGVEIKSDGTDREWEDGRQFCESLFGFAAVPFGIKKAA